MNLHGIASRAIGAINPNRPVKLLRCSGYTINPSGKQIPTYAPAITCTAQIQDLSSTDLKKMDGINIQGSSKSLYLNGDWRGVIRVDGVGGDLVQFDGYTWLITMVSEQWPDWTKILVTLQNGS